MRTLTDVQRAIIVQLLGKQPTLDEDLHKELKSAFPNLTITKLRRSIEELANGWRYIEAHETKWGYKIKMNSVGETEAKRLVKMSEIVVDSIHTLDDEAVLERIVGSGEGETLEFKNRLPGPSQMSRDIAAFANAKGGLILYGVNETGRITDSIEPHKFSDAVRMAFGRVDPSPKNISWGLVHYRGKSLGAVLINPTEDTPVFADGSVFRRVGARNIQLSRADFLTTRDDRSKPESLGISEQTIKRFMSVADEDAFTEVLLIPFLRHLGFRSVMGKGHRDKTLEFGQDLRSFKLQLPTGHWLYYAAQVKTGDIRYAASKKSSNIDSILTQVKMAFDYEMFDTETNTMNLPDHVLLVTTGEIGEGARLFLSQTLAREKRRRILMWDGRYVVERILDQGLPKGCQIEIERYDGAPRSK